MKTNKRQILLYGDSLIYGKKPGSIERYEMSENFTGIIQSRLGDDFNVMSEGLRARNLVGENPFFPERDGLQQFGPIFGSHVPLDLVVLMLGTNDCNKSPKREVGDIEKALDSYRAKMGAWCKQLGMQTVPKLLIVAPPHIHNTEVAKNSVMQNIFGPDAEERSVELGINFKNYCEKNSIPFFNAASVCVPAIGEGVHLDPENNRKLGEALAEVVKSLF